MKTNAMRLGVTVLAALALASGGLSTAQAEEGHGEKHPGDRKIVVKGHHNQIVTGDENVVGGRNAESSGHGETEKAEDDGADAANPREPYATVRSNVNYLAERTEPTTEAEETARFGPGSKIEIVCYITDGESVHDDPTWYEVPTEDPQRPGYVAAYYTTLTGKVTKC